jgi:hypothetical protein
MRRTAPRDRADPDPSTVYALVWRLLIWFGKLLQGRRGLSAAMAIIMAVLAIPSIAYAVTDVLGCDPMRSLVKFACVRSGPGAGQVPDKPTVRYVSAYVSPEGSEQDCEKGECTIRYLVSGYFEVPAGQVANYSDRIKTVGRVESLRTFPAHVKLNEGQFKGNPTYLEYRISPPDATERLHAQVELVIRKPLSPGSGKIGFHFPYFTERAVIMVDFRNLGFQPAAQLQQLVEVSDQVGLLREGTRSPVMRSFLAHSVVMLVDGDLPPGSSLVLRWPPE